MRTHYPLHHMAEQMIETQSDSTDIRHTPSNEEPSLWQTFKCFIGIHPEVLDRGVMEYCPSCHRIWEAWDEWDEYK